MDPSTEEAQVHRGLQALKAHWEHKVLQDRQGPKESRVHPAHKVQQVHRVQRDQLALKVHPALRAPQAGLE